jgi:hypothetical protein
MKILVFRNGIYTVLRPLYYLCKVFGLASYSYVADRRNKRATPDYGYLNYMFAVLWLVVFTVGLPVQILETYSSLMFSQTLFIAVILYIISSYTSSLVAVVWLSFIKRKKYLEMIENISEVDNKIRYTLQEETYMNRTLMLNIISEIILLTLFQCTVIIYNVYLFRSKGSYVFMLIVIFVVTTYICNTLFLFQYINLVFMVKQRYSHLNNRLNNWISGTVIGLYIRGKITKFVSDPKGLLIT